MYILHNILFCNCILAFCNITCASSILIHPLLYRNAMSRNHFLQEIIIRGRKTFASWLKINTLRKMAEWLLRGMNLWLAKRQIKFDQNEESSDRILHLPSPCCYLIPSCTDHDHITLQRRSETIGTMADTMNATFFPRLLFSALKICVCRLIFYHLCLRL